MRAWIAAVLVVPATAHAEDHTVEVSYDAATTASAGRGEAGLVDTGVSAAASDTISIGGFQIILGGGAGVHHLEGAARATGLTSNAQLAIGPAPLPPSNQDASRWSVFPLTFEVSHEGDLAALPRLSDRLDVKRAPYAWQRVSAATRLVRIEVADDGYDDAKDPEHRYPRDRSTGASDIVPVRGTATVTEQGDTRRVDATVSIAPGGAVIRWPFQADLQLFGVESRLSRIEDVVSVTRTFWIMRMDTHLPSGLTYTIGWGYVLGVDDQGEREQVVDHDKDEDVLVSIGLGGGIDEAGGGIQFVHREPYIALDGRGMFDTRGWLELWFHAKAIRWYGRAFYAQTRRIVGSDRHADWTGGLELEASRDVGPFGVELSAEAGRSFYGPLDGADGTPGFGARGALTIRRADGRRWFY